MARSRIRLLLSSGMFMLSSMFILFSIWIVKGIEFIANRPGNRLSRQYPDMHVRLGTQDLTVTPKDQAGKRSVGPNAQTRPRSMVFQSYIVVSCLVAVTMQDGIDGCCAGQLPDDDDRVTPDSCPIAEAPRPF